MIVVLILSSVRSDVAIYNIVLLVLILFLRIDDLRFRWFSATILSAALTYFLLARDTVGMGMHANLTWLGSVGSFPFHILVEAPAVLMGNFGHRGPLNIWGLSWYDIPIPSFVSIFMIFLLGFLVKFSFTNSSSLRQLTLLAGFMATYLFLVIALISTRGNPPGGFIQSRYMLPMFTGVLLLALLSTRNKDSDSVRKCGTISTSSSVIWISIFAASFVSLLVSVTRFGNGLAVVSEPWLTNFTSNPSFSWVAGDRVLYQLPNLKFFYSPVLQSSVLVIFLVMLASATVATIGKGIFSRTD
jgi:hypothetical protein